MSGLEFSLGGFSQRLGPVCFLFRLRASGLGFSWVGFRRV